MPTLDLYKPRRFSVVKLNDGKEYKIPTEYLVEEAERILEYRARQEALENEEVTDEVKQVGQFQEIVFAQIEIIFQHYQPDVTAEYLKKHLTFNEALEILGFFDKYRPNALKEIKAEQEEESKKKLN